MSTHPRRLAVLWSGGKDSTLALDRMHRQGRQIDVLVNLYDQASRRVRFHGVRRELIQRQAEALGIRLLQRAVSPENFEAVFIDALHHLKGQGIEGVVLGDIHLADVRAWYEERTTDLGFAHVEPLWGEDPVALVDELLARGYRAFVTGINESGRGDWLGRELDAALRDAFIDAGIDHAGEHGEYHTFVYDGPLFATPIVVLPGQVVEREGHAQIDLV